MTYGLWFAVFWLGGVNLRPFVRWKEWIWILTAIKHAAARWKVRNGVRWLLRLATKRLNIHIKYSYDKHATKAAALFVEIIFVWMLGKEFFSVEKKKRRKFAQNFISKFANIWTLSMMFWNGWIGNRGFGSTLIQIV